ncbi:MAG: signal peptidase I [Thermoplasmata archaeon]|nr:signal peptidase I [Thermoplasmata archaeon]
MDRSMLPALTPGDRLYVDPKAYRARPPSVGDLVVFPDPRDPSRRLIKRVAATGPGRFQLGREGVVPVPVPGTGPVDAGALEELELTPSQLLVLSDARRAGADSRFFGAIERSALEGQAWFRFSPKERRGPV